MRSQQGQQERSIASAATHAIDREPEPLVKRLQGKEEGQAEQHAEEEGEDGKEGEETVARVEVAADTGVATTIHGLSWT